MPHHFATGLCATSHVIGVLAMFRQPAAQSLKRPLSSAPLGTAVWKAHYLQTEMLSFGLVTHGLGVFFGLGKRPEKVI